MQSVCSLFGSGLGLLGFLGEALSLSLLLLGVLVKELFVVFNSLLGGLVSVKLVALLDGLSADALLSDKSLDLWGFPEGLVATLDLAVSNVSADIVLFGVQSEHLSDSASSLLTETVGAVSVGDSIDVLLSLLDNSEEDDGEVGTVDASTD